MRNAKKELLVVVVWCPKAERELFADSRGELTDRRNAEVYTDRAAAVAAGKLTGLKFNLMDEADLA